MKAATHPRQTERLAALRDIGILDTDREKDFDDVVRLASAICGTAISVINLIDEDRQWFKAEIGLGVRETPLDTSLCSHVILEDGFVEIPDTVADRRMADNPLCLGDAGLRFYAGAPLLTAEGLPLGTLCVLDYQPRELTDLQREALTVLARQVMKQLELRRALAQAEVLRQEVDHRVKNSLLSVVALTRLHARSSTSAEVKAALKTVVQRIETVASLHDQLYRTNATNRIDIAQYLTNVAGFLDGVRPGHVTLTVDAAPATLESRRAAAVAVVVNEFVQNAFTHAFPDERPGHVTVRGGHGDDGIYRLVLRDDGIGFPVDHTRPGGLGLAVIDASSGQLQGEYRRCATDRGTCAELRFPVE